MGREKEGSERPDKETGLTDRAYLFIKEAIVDYRLKPGAALGLRNLAAVLEMSHTPVREALLRLEQEQFVDRSGSKGFVVASFRPDEVRELYDLRTVLEVAVVGWAAERFDKGQEKEIARAIEEAEVLLRNGSRPKILAQEYRFHALVLEAGGNLPLQRMVQATLDRIRLIQNLSLLTEDRLVLAQQQHREIFGAMVARDPQKASELMESHLREARDYLLARLANEDDILSLLLSGPPGEELKPATMDNQGA